MSDTTDTRRLPMMGAPPIPFGAPTRPRPLGTVENATIEAVRQAVEPPPPAPTYRSCVADSVNECRYLDVKGIAKEIIGEPAKPIETAADLADRMAEWAAENKTAVAA